MKVFHILNGDALKAQLPSNAIRGEIIVARECLVDGDVAGNTLDEIIRCRIRSMNEMYGISEREYLQKTVPEFKKIVDINEGEVNLWFEDDLFCQVNFWFVCSLLEDKILEANLVRPSSSLRYGFGGMSPNQLFIAFNNRTSLDKFQIQKLAQLWRAYQLEDSQAMVSICQSLSKDLPFLKPALQAQLDRKPNGDGLPERTLREIMSALGESDFGPVFQEFSKRLPIYGFGDLQVKRILVEMNKK